MSAVKKLATTIPRPILLKALLVRDQLVMLGEFAQDYARYRRFSGPPDTAVHSGIRGRNLEAQLTKDYHRIEKGLSFRAPKRPFGSAVSQRLESLLPLAQASDNDRLVALQGPVMSAQAALDGWNSGGVADTFVSPEGVPPIALSTEQAEQFFTSRHSLRNFDESRPVSNELIAAALGFVSRTPSVCNRQSGNVHIYSDPDQIRQILKLQAGSAGFSDTITQLAAITVENGLFTGSGERNQRWVDGSLAAMTFVWALHSLGVHSCMLNWSKRNVHSRELRSVGNIPASQDIICLVAFGYPPESGYRVARSPRRELSDFSTIH